MLSYEEQHCGAMQSAGRLRFLSKPSSKRALTEISNLAWGSNTRSRGRSFTALVPSVMPRKIRNWVSKDERQAMVKEFINKHRSGNSGKFPTASYIKKEVGGSYYFVRKILQEVEYKSKLSSSNTGNESSNKKDLPKENEGSNEFKENMSRYITVDAKIREDGQAVSINGMVTSDSSCMHSEVKKGTKVSVSFDKIKSVPDIDSSKSKAEDHQQLPEYSCPEKTEDVKEETCKPMLDIDGSKSKAEEHQPSSEYPSTKKLEDLKEETPYESLLDIDVSKSKAERHQSLLDLETFAREDLTEKQMEKIPKKSSIWVNLKYFAEGIINIWRKH